MPYTETPATGHRLVDGVRKAYNITVKVWAADTQETAEQSLEEQVKLYGTIACAKAISSYMITQDKNGQASQGPAKLEKIRQAMQHMAANAPEKLAEYAAKYTGVAWRDMMVEYYDRVLPTDE